MRLNSALVERTLYQFDAQVVPDAHPAMPKPVALFGDHTFFLDKHRLNIVEPTESPEKGMLRAKVVELARWTDTNRSELAPHEPEPTEVLVVLDTTH
jgi:hypothetical protein